MPTLLEKPVPVSAPAHHPVLVLHSRHRWAQWRGVLIALLIGLTATLAALVLLHPSWHTPTNWKMLAAVWTGGELLTIIAAAIAWRFAPASLADTAQTMDRNLAAKNRLEAAAALHDSASPLARAQREETAAYLERDPRARPVRALPWLVAGIIALLIAHLVLLAVWVIPSLFHPAAPVPPPPPKEMPRASIVWKSPEPESKANPVEEVPTVAVAQSTTGLRNLSLEISVNGAAKKSVPLPAKPYDAAGKNDIKVSLYMDELGVQPFDVVSYFLRAQRITSQKVPDTTSAIQFIQVRPFREDVGQMRGMPAEGNKNLNLLLQLKLAELRSIKENFILAHTDLSVTDPVRVKENDRVGKNQGDLSAKTEEVVQAFILAGYSADMIDLLRQAEPPMDDASKKILATQNAAALPSQEKALNLIVEVEKFFRKVIVDGPGGPPPPPSPDDPFKDKRQHEMKKRFETAAGQLEQLAKNQAKLSQDLSHNDSPGSSGASSPDNAPAQDKPTNGNNSPSGQNNTPPSPAPGAHPGDAGKPVPLPTPQSVDPFQPDTGAGSFPERQARVLQGIETLLNTNDVLPPTVNTALQDARTHATESIHQLDQGNEADAREPAAAAAEDLQRAVTEMNTAGAQATKLAMEEAQQKLNDQAQKLRDIDQAGHPGEQQPGLSDLAAQVRETRKQVQDAADQQQAAGSGQGAQQLNQLANQIGKQNIASDLDGMAKSGLDVKKAQEIAQKLEGLAAQAAQGPTPGKPSAQDIAALVNSLEKSRANLARLAEKAGAPGIEVAGLPPSAPGSTATPGQAGQAPGDKNQTPSPGAGKDQGKGQGQQPGAQPGQGQDQGKGQGQQPGTQPGQGQDQGKGQGQQPGTQPGQGQDQGKGQGQQPGAQPGQGQDQGKGQGQQPGTQPGQGQDQGKGQQPGAQPGQGQDQGKGQGHGNTPSNNSNPNPSDTAPQPDQASPAPGNGGGTGQDGSNGVEGKAYREVISDLKNEVQQASVLVPGDDATGGTARALEDTHYRDTKIGNAVVAYQAIAPPLDKLISNLRERLARAQREDIVRQPDLDEAPPSYRPAVSDYFETMSRDYHPDGADQDVKKP